MSRAPSGLSAQVRTPDATVRTAAYRVTLQVAALAMVTLVTGCSSLPSLSSLNPFTSKSKTRTPPAALVEIKPGLTVRTVWTAPVGASGAYTFTPAMSGDSIYAAARDGAISRVDAATGKPVWRINAGSTLTAGVGTDGNTVVVAGEKGKVMAFDASGTVRWTAQTSSEVLSAPAVGQGLVIVRSQDNRIVGFDAVTGARKWVVQRTAPALILRSAPGILLAAPNAYVALPGGKLLAITLATGAPRWEAAVGDARGTTELERVIDTSGMPVAVGDMVCAVSFQGRAMCFDGTSGTVRWSKDLSADVGLGADERFVFAADVTGGVNALTRESGASVWKNTQLGYRRLSAPVSIGRTVAVGDYQGFVHFLGREDGAMLGRVATDGSEIVAAPLLVGPNLVVQTRAGALVAVTAE
jgi:outer membrane protein assembly factor BamB